MNKQPTNIIKSIVDDDLSKFAINTIAKSLLMSSRNLKLNDAHNLDDIMQTFTEGLTFSDVANIERSGYEYMDWVASSADSNEDNVNNRNLWDIASQHPNESVCAVALDVLTEEVAGWTDKHLADVVTLNDKDLKQLIYGLNNI